MFRQTIKSVVVMLLLCFSQQGFAQYATEIMIPLGQSPGLSGQHTIMGGVDSVDLQNRLVEISDPSAGMFKVEVSDKASIWLDRSQQQLSNQTIALGDISQGMRIEVKYLGNDENAGVEWIKVRAAPPLAPGAPANER